MSKSAVAVWDFTIPEIRLDRERLIEELDRYAKRWAFQLEVGESGYRHWQGRCSLKAKARKGPPIVEGIHWSPTSGGAKADEFYVMKEETRIDGPWTDRDPKIPRQVREIKELRPWQNDVLASADVWDTRTINCIVDEHGNIGKSTLVAYAGAHKLGRAVPIMESYKDMMRFVMDTPESRLYMVDFPRALSKSQTESFWAAIETIKSGYCWDDRYHFRERYFDCPAVWVFTNKFPPRKMLSADRWKLWHVEEEQLVAVEFPGASL